MAELKYFADNQKALGENYRFWELIREKNGERYELFFDTADLIDMLRGMQGLASGYAFKWEHYNKPKQLVYAVAYQNWLGHISILPPHLTELYNKISAGQTLFPEFPLDQQMAEDEFWPKYLPADLVRFIEKPNEWPESSEVVEALMSAAPHIFQGIYLMQKGGYWKKRYRYLKENGILYFDVSPFDVMEISKDPVFKAFQKELNSIRSHNTSNNYIDALALSMLDRKLDAYLSKPDKLPVPLFYTDQEHIHQAIEKVAQLNPKRRPPLHIRNQDNDWVPIVRNADFFFLWGILRGAEQEDVALFKKLSDCFESLHEAKEKSSKLEEAKAAIDKRTREEEAPNTLLLEFFKRWWEQRGIQELREVFKEDYNLDKEQEQTITVSVNEYIQREREHLDHELGRRAKVMNLLRQIWKELQHLDRQFNQVYDSDIEIIAAHEFGSRFSFSKPVYETIQRHFDRLKAVVFGGDLEDIEEAKTETVNFIFDALTTQGKITPEQRIDKLNNLASAIGILWLLEKFPLINDICRSLRETNSLKENISDAYPSPAFAIMHAVAKLQMGDPDLAKVQAIVNCVESKFDNPSCEKNQNYKVWMALSYVYYRMATARFPQLYVIPEDLPSHDRESKIRKAALNYLEKTLYFSEKTIGYLKDKISNAEDCEQLPRWCRVYYYAVNNAIFVKTIALSDADKLSEMEDLVEELSNLTDISLYHENRYSDTLARYYYRLGKVKKSKMGNFYLRKARSLNQRSKESYGLVEKRVFQVLGDHVEKLLLERSGEV